MTALHAIAHDTDALVAVGVPFPHAVLAAVAVHGRNAEWVQVTPDDERKTVRELRVFVGEREDGAA